MLGALPPGATYRIVARSEASTAEASVALGTAPLKRDLSFANRRPAIAEVTAFDGAKAARLVAPGATVRVEARASDPDGQPLHYRWDGPGRQLRARRRALGRRHDAAHAGTRSVYVQVSDGVGQYAAGWVRVAVGPAVSLFSGKLASAGADVAGAERVGATYEVIAQADATCLKLVVDQTTLGAESSPFFIRLTVPGAPASVCEREVDKNVDDGSYADDDYDAIDADLDAWKARNGFAGGDDAEGYDFDAGDLEFGRSMPMNRRADGGMAPTTSPTSSTRTRPSRASRPTSSSTCCAPRAAPATPRAAPTRASTWPRSRCAIASRPPSPARSATLATCPSRSSPGATSGTAPTSRTTWQASLGLPGGVGP